MDERAAADEVGRLYPAVYRRFKASHRPVGDSGLTARMLAVLQHLAAAGPLTVGELAEHLRLSKAATTELVNRVEERGLVGRMRDERDRRRVFVWVTDEGQAKAAATREVLAGDALLDAVRRMSPDDRDRLIDGLRALLRAAGEEEP
ncbi:MAG TPA: MarR family winged helix-turn-helix transcriptional regulator [Streptosporangiaceae bacterium]|jgi:DNA-binding MarR family transcriptional regulator